MFFFRKNDNNAEEMSTLQDFPCLSLESSPLVVPLPGILYKISFKRPVAEEILKYFKNAHQFQSHFLLADVKSTQNHEGVLPSTVESLETFRRTFDLKEQEKGLYICLIPHESKNKQVGCISKIVGVLTEKKAITISFKTLQRATIKRPLLNSKNQVWSSEIFIMNDLGPLQHFSNSELKQMITPFVQAFESVNDTINAFKKENETAFEKDSKRHLLLLSPLSNTLFFQLNNAQFSKAWSMLLGYVKELTSVSKGASPKLAAVQVVNLMDLTVAVLPTTISQRLTFLSTFMLAERCERFKIITDEFGELFEQLYSSTDYVQRHYSHASSLEKTRLIANQLKSLRYFIEDFKAQQSMENEKRLSGGNSLSDSKNKKSLIPQEGDGEESGGYNDSKDNDDDDDDDDDNLLKLYNFIKSLAHLGVHIDGIKMLRKDFKRFSSTTPQNSEYQVLRNYFDVVLDIPFGVYTKRESIDLEKSREKLDNDHYGLKKVKNRLMEYLCTLKLNEQLKKMDGVNKRAPILLLVGPPGVGKTSIGKSIAEMLNLKFQRVSLGGIHNEAEIRGHRRTYVGSMCGTIINALRKSGCMNPLILLDEVDKVLSTTGSGSGYGFKLNGDPGAALLEVLDPEQNSTFMDHYIGFPVDLSQVLFFCTANDLAGISAPLLDRMEVIEISGYTPKEKIQIGSKFLLPKQIRINGLDRCHQNFTLTDQAWNALVLEYVREPGVRNLERKLATIVRGKVVEYIRDEHGSHEGKSNIVHKKDICKYLGFPLHAVGTELLRNVRMAEKEGTVNGLSYNSDGTGSVLVLELIMTGSVAKQQGPTITATGNLGTVLQESIDIGCSLVKSILRRGLIIGENCRTTKEFFSSKYHLHVPMGAISKDGPSAGTAITLALMSLALKRAVDPLLCITGEITLRGKVLPIGGVREKLLGAQIYGMKRVILPRANRPDVIESMTDSVVPYIENSHLQDELALVQEKMGLTVVYVDDIYDVLQTVWPDIAFRSEMLVEHDHQCVSKM